MPLIAKQANHIIKNSKEKEEQINKNSASE